MWPTLFTAFHLGNESIFQIADPAQAMNDDIVFRTLERSGSSNQEQALTSKPTQLAERRCAPCEGGVPPLTPDQANSLRDSLGPHWQLNADTKELVAHLEFRNYFRTLAFVNAVAYMAIQQDHHPDITFGYKTAVIRYTTHAIGGLSENDFICAARVDALLNF